jgi:hypothetical protein
MIPDDGVATAYVPESGSQTPTSSCSGGGVGVTATNDQLVFEQSDDVTGTIKRQPMELNRRIAAAVNSSYISHERRQSSEGGSLKVCSIGLHIEGFKLEHIFQSWADPY